MIQYQNGDGNDVLIGLSEKSSISIGGAVYATTKNINGAFIKVGDGVLTVKGGADLSIVNMLGTLDQSKNFNNTKANALIIANNLDNTVSNSGNNVTIFANGSNDTIDNRGSYVTINGGAGIDSIKNKNSNVTIDAGADNDTIMNYSNGTEAFGRRGR